MKFIHVSNVHIGMSPDPDKFWSNDRSNDIKETFAKITEKCNEESVDLLLISGNLFNHQPTTEELDFVNNLFKKIPGTNVLIVAGSSDYIKSNSPILNYNFSTNVHYFLNNIIDKHVIDDKKVIVHGLSYYSIEEPTDLTANINIDNENYIHILMFYGGDTRHVPYDVSKISDKNLSYVAIGYNNNYQEIIKNKIYSPGSPEPLDQNDEGDHGIIIGEIDNSTKKLLYTKFIKTAKLAYIPIVVKVNSKTTEADIVTLVTKEVSRLGEDNIYKISIKGMRNPDIEFSDYMFSSKIKISSFVDNSSPKYDYIKLSSEHPQDMIGAFIRKMTLTSQEPSEVEKKALYIGTYALLKSKDKEK